MSADRRLATEAHEHRNVPWSTTVLTPHSEVTTDKFCGFIRVLEPAVWAGKFLFLELVRRAGYEPAFLATEVSVLALRRPPFKTSLAIAP